jgi:invasion protein IalB
VRKIILAVAALVAAGTNIAVAQTSPKTTKKFGDWALSCRQLAADGPERCVLFQDILWKKGGKRILNVSLARAGKDKPFVAAVTTPLGILLPAGLTLNVDDKELVRFPLRFCNINGCRGQFPITEAMQKLFSNGNKGRVQFRQPNGRPLRVEFSLKGFEAGFMVLKTK